MLLMQERFHFIYMFVMKTIPYLLQEPVKMIGIQRLQIFKAD